ncbi:MAG: isoleucine--tRNA ligase [Candidatus Heimdallarchaeota archaeon]|nr:MAG: isoleucine--tRNA ligase [Candidatus Heimdallarchaeota archaeon]
MTKPLFTPVASELNWSDVEKTMLQFWEEREIFQKLRKQLQMSKTQFSFIDGPITANNPMGVHTARGRTLKDIYQRYWAMRGYNQRFQNGFDTQGLWVEVEVEKSLGLNSKNDILDMGLEAFMNKCKARISKYADIITQQSKQLGQQMDWDNSYYTHTDQNIEHIWYFLKTCNEKSWLYQSRLVMPWCPRCSTSLSAHEMADSYRIVEHPSVFLQLPVLGTPNRYFLVWTTTPWTLTANTGLAVHPELAYVLVKIKNKEFYLAEDATSILGDEYTLLDTFQGKELLKFKYKAPFTELSLQKDVQYKIIPWEDVSSDEGTGIVHIAPGCGAEDFELGKQYKLNVVAPIDERGHLVEGLGSLSGLNTNEVVHPIFESLSEKEFLFKIENIRHRYPVCWRCKTELVYKLEKEWFISCDEIRPLLQKANKEVLWVPNHAGKRMHDWLENMADWCISRKRYWGLPLPFYPCSCGELTVVGSLNELRTLAEAPSKVENLPELHRPWIDDVKIKCPKCNNNVERVLEVGDCWLDAGIVPFSTLNYCNNREEWKKWFPADMVCEMVEQVRLWFYSQLFMSVTLVGRAPFRVIVVYEEVRSEDGSPMHKSSGNAIDFDYALREMGADVMRWNYATQKSENLLRFGFTVTNEVRRKFLPFWNAVRFFLNFAALDITNASQLSQSSNNIFDLWILAKLQYLVNQYHESLTNWDCRRFTLLLEEFFNDLTNWYIRGSRRRFWKEKDLTNDKNPAYSTLYQVLLTISYLLAPFMPFLSEHIFQLLHRPLDKQLPESVHLCSLPSKEVLSNFENVVESFAKYQNLIEIGRSLRNETQIKLRQPLPLAIVSGDHPFTTSKFKTQLLEYLKHELNVKELKFVKDFSNELVLDQQYLSQSSNEYPLTLTLVTEISSGLKREGLARELVRVIQRLRKEADLELDAKIRVVYETNSLDLSKSLELHEEYVKIETLALEISSKPLENNKPFLIDGDMINLGIEVVSR